MTSTVHTCSPEATLSEVMTLMNERHIRHVPVVEDGALVGILSIRDLISARLHEAEIERQQMADYIAQPHVQLSGVVEEAVSVRAGAAREPSSSVRESLPEGARSADQATARERPESLRAGRRVPAAAVDDGGASPRGCCTRAAPGRCTKVLVATATPHPDRHAAGRSSTSLDTPDLLIGHMASAIRAGRIRGRRRRRDTSSAVGCTRSSGRAWSPRCTSASPTARTRRSARPATTGRPITGSTWSPSRPPAVVR